MSNVLSKIQPGSHKHGLQVCESLDARASPVSVDTSIVVARTGTVPFICAAHHSSTRGSGAWLSCLPARGFNSAIILPLLERGLNLQALLSVCHELLMSADCWAAKLIMHANK